MGKLVENTSEKRSMSMRWCLRPTGPHSVSGPILPGVYGLQNKASETYVSLSPDESTVSCWSEFDLEKTGVKLVRYHCTFCVCYELMIVVGDPSSWGRVYDSTPRHRPVLHPDIRNRQQGKGNCIPSPCGMEDRYFEQSCTCQRRLRPVSKTILPFIIEI